MDYTPCSDHLSKTPNTPKPSVTSTGLRQFYTVLLFNPGAELENAHTRSKKRGLLYAQKTWD